MPPASDPDFAAGGVGEELDVPDARPQLVKDDLPRRMIASAFMRLKAKSPFAECGHGRVSNATCQ
jgi:hypothetical protein